MKLSRTRLAFVTVAVAASTAFTVAATDRPATAGGAYPVPTVARFGTAGAFPQLSGALNQPVVDVAGDPSGPGYWVAASDGGVFSFGHAKFYGSTGAIRLHRPIVAIAPTKSGKGYWLIASDGGVFSFGDAHFYGSLGNVRLAAPIVAATSTPSGKGYWLAASDGGVFSFGDAHFYGSGATLWKNGAVIDIAASKTGKGYALLVSDGAVFKFGDAPSVPNATHGGSAVSITRSKNGGMYVTARDGRVFAFGGAQYKGSANGKPINAIGLATTSDGNGYWIATLPPGPPAPPASGSGRRIVYSISAQRVWTVEADNSVSNFWRVSGRNGSPPVGTYRIQSRSVASSSGSLKLPYMQRFVQARSGKWIGFHGIPLRPDGTPIQTDAQLGTPLSAGCVRMNQTDVKTLWDWAPLGTAVVVLA